MSITFSVFFSLSLVFSPPCILSLFFSCSHCFSSLCFPFLFPLLFFLVPSPLSVCFFFFMPLFSSPCFSFFPPCVFLSSVPPFFFYFYKARDSPVLVMSDFNAFNGETSLTFYC
jgi:hypothetical protein